LRSWNGSVQSYKRGWPVPATSVPAASTRRGGAAASRTAPARGRIIPGTGRGTCGPARRAAGRAPGSWPPPSWTRCAARTAAAAALVALRLATAGGIAGGEGRTARHSAIPARAPQCRDQARARSGRTAAVITPPSPGCFRLTSRGSGKTGRIGWSGRCPQVRAGPCAGRAYGVG